jgi:hypothetical protein
MSKLVTQKLDGDCAICCLAMLTGLPHDVVIQASLGKTWDADGMGDFGAGLKRLGYGSADFRCFDVPNGVSEFALETILWRRKAILAAKSLNSKGGYHAIYWDGKKLLDPSNLKRFTELSEIAPKLVEIVLFDEIR